LIAGEISKQNKKLKCLTLLEEKRIKMIVTQNARLLRRLITRVAVDMEITDHQKAAQHAIRVQPNALNPIRVK